MLFITPHAKTALIFAASDNIHTHMYMSDNDDQTTSRPPLTESAVGATLLVTGPCFQPMQAPPRLPVDARADLADEARLGALRG